MYFIDDSTINLENNKRDTFNVLAYSDIFQYPLTKNEIYSRGKLELDELELCLDRLLAEEKIYLLDNFYSIHNDRKLINVRKERNKRAERSMDKARFMVRVIINFPFIRGVCLSGSISKNCMDKNSDIDFFIIAAPKRLWITNLFCSMFRRTILLNSSKYFCFNYILDSEHLEIDERTIYTAIELKTLIPLFGYAYYKQLINENAWITDFFPKYPLASDQDVSKNQPGIQRFLERFFANDFGEWLDEWLLNYSVKKRRKRLAAKLFESPNFYTNLQRHVAKSHINDNYPNIIKEYSQKIDQHTYQKATV